MNPILRLILGILTFSAILALSGLSGCAITPRTERVPGPRPVPWERVLRDDDDWPPRYIEVLSKPKCPFWAGSVSHEAAMVICQPVYSTEVVTPDSCRLANPPILRITKDAVRIIEQEELCKGS